jgi:hypothetical protein
MRLWLVLLMIVFTPLRGLAADVMAISMAGQHGAPAHHGAAMVPAAHAADTAALSLSDCDGHHAVPADQAAQPAPDALAALPDGDCPTCASCMVCSSAAQALSSAMSSTLPIHHALPAPGSATFSSAAPLPGFKPPIS